jgi:hypothetical protein
MGNITNYTIEAVEGGTGWEAVSTIFDSINFLGMGSGLLVLGLAAVFILVAGGKDTRDMATMVILTVIALSFAGLLDSPLLVLLIIIILILYVMTTQKGVTGRSINIGGRK